MMLQRYSIAARIGCVVGGILVMMLVLAFVEMKGLNNIRKSLDNIVGRHYQRLQTVQELRFLARHGAVLVRNVLLVDTSEARARERTRFEDSAARYMALLAQLTKQEQSKEEHDIIRKVADGSEAAFKLWQMVAAEEKSSNPAEAMRILQAEVRNRQWGLLGNLDELVQVEKRLVEVAMKEARDNYLRTKSIMVMINILAVGAGLFFVAAITASIVGPLREITQKVDRIAGGDLTTRIDLEHQDEIGQLAGHINRMVEKLNASEDELEEYRYHLEELIEMRTGEMNEQRERFISVLIHDLKGPLVPIIGFSRLLMARDNLSEEKIACYVREIHDSTTKLGRVIDQTTRRLREKRMSLSFDEEPFDVKELLHSVSRSCQPALKAESITLKVNGQEVDEYYESTGGVMYSGDICKLRSLLENLIGNAGKYAASRIDIQLHGTSEKIELVVDDDGCGVAEPFRKKIFEEYYQAPGSKEGTGVGLYSVKRIVDHYQGKIAVQASPLGGARFVVTLPLT